MNETLTIISELQRGDSGAWVMNINNRTAYGHIMAVTSDDVLIQPLVDIFQDIQNQKKLDVKIASPFGQLANLAKHYYFGDEHHLAVSLARKALDPGVISQSTEGPQVTAMLPGFMRHTDKGDKFLPRYSRNHLADFLTNLIMCTGRNIDLIRSPTWTDDWTAMFGNPMSMIEHVNYLKGAGGLPTLDEIEAASGRKTVSDQDLPSTQSRVRDLTAQRHRENKASRAIDKIIKRAYDWVSRLFSHTEMQFTMVGLPGCGKSDLLRGITNHDSATASMSIVGFITTRIQRNGTIAKIWDISEDVDWRLNWGKYSRGVDGVVFVVDTGDTEILSQVHRQILMLMSQPMLSGVSLIVFGNNSSNQRGLKIEELKVKLDLEQIMNGRHVDFWVGDGANFDKFLDFLIKRRNE
ncbi:ADP-ribosylation factor-like protein 8 [Fusarium oxysporum f. sp. cubense]|uniref:ADP-ribosylation factor-like protein 8 n=1 Tax=Fusarium oxysporum f. sp. cubense TaxID=61366 RepID=A0A559KUE2_FUSOC|nr:ADP-ribosylation factor-like protein 8 [Fusarium oxysporum f. sp. cubense]